MEEEKDREEDGEEEEEVVRRREREMKALREVGLLQRKRQCAVNLV